MPGKTFQICPTYIIGKCICLSKTSKWVFLLSHQKYQPHLFHPPPTPFLPKFRNFNRPIYEKGVIICDTIIKNLHSTGFLEIINQIKFDPLTRASLPMCFLFLTIIILQNSGLNSTLYKLPS